MAKLNEARRDEIFEVLCDYAKIHKGNSPSIRDLERELKMRGYQITRTPLIYHLKILEGAGRLLREDGKLIVVDSEWFPPD